MKNSIFKIKRLFTTILYLKPIQFYYRLYYAVRKKIRILFNRRYLFIKRSKVTPLVLCNTIPASNCFNKNTFIFLNRSYKYNEKIDWNYGEYGKLWTYNLTYFDYLNQEEINEKTAKKIIYDFIDNIYTVKDGLMPFPISLRSINWIKFLSKYQIIDPKINDSLYAQYYILLDNIEYHILGNHLLENGFSLLIGAYYFQDEKLYNRAHTILINELEEQILNDGAHFELSPMYHQIMLFRVLDCINVMQHNRWKEKELLSFFVSKAEKMLGWLKCMTFKNGEIPLFNDSTNGIAPTSKELFDYALKLNIKPKKILLRDSGYRKISHQEYECIIDVGNIGPDYIPGHAHSDTFNFELYVKGSPVIVDTGLSTYEANEVRTMERSTSSHNTVELEGENQTEVWGGFRVAKRAKIIHLLEKNNMVQATHNGYKSMGCLHSREWYFFENSIKILDIIKGEEIQNAIAYLHFHPNLAVEIEDNHVITSLIKIVFPPTVVLSLSEYNYASEFNQTIKSLVLKVIFKNNLTMEIITL